MQSQLHHYYAFCDLVNVAQHRSLTAVIVANPAHVLRPLFPPTPSRRPGLRRRDHPFSLSTKRIRIRFLDRCTNSYFPKMINHLLNQQLDGQLKLYLYPNHDGMVSNGSDSAALIYYFVSLLFI